MRRKNCLVNHQFTSVGQRIPKNPVDFAEDFLQNIEIIGDFQHMVKMNETPCYFHIPHSSSLILQVLSASVGPSTAGIKKRVFRTLAFIARCI